MKYETPEVVALTNAINAIQATPPDKVGGPLESLGSSEHEITGAYEDWE
jgi:hypothetical protein